jgi:hypothetical protein
MELKTGYDTVTVIREKTSPKNTDFAYWDNLLSFLISLRVDTFFWYHFKQTCAYY